MNNGDTERRRQHSIWITWENQTRNRSMSQLLDVPLHEVTTKKEGLLRYIILTTRTAILLMKRKPKNLFVQNPSIVLALMATILKRVFRYQLFIDAHNVAIEYLQSENSMIRRASWYINRKSDYIMVSNFQLSLIVKDFGGSPIVATDPVPTFQKTLGRPNDTIPNQFFLFICSWAEDEPYFSVIEAFSKLKDDHHLMITGNFRKVLSDKEVEAIPKNVTLLGFVDESSYIFYIENSIANIDLTTRQDCLVCGAYESMSVNRPCLLSNTSANRSTFLEGFEYTDSDASSIKHGIHQIVNNLPTLEAGIKIECDRHKKMGESTRREILHLMNSVN